MKNTLLRTVVILVALCIYPSIHAYDFECDGFYYDITSDSTVSVTYEGSTEYEYEGDIILISATLLSSHDTTVFLRFS